LFKPSSFLLREQYTELCTTRRLAKRRIENVLVDVVVATKMSGTAVRASVSSARQRASQAAIEPRESAGCTSCGGPTQRARALICIAQRITSGA
jgi:hypothetical protein